jgi:hypothetical protein
MNMLSTNHNILFKATILALCVISFVHIFLFPLYDMDAGRNPSKTFTDFEQSLCTSNIKHKKSWKRANCPQYGIVTIMQGGRLGNQMWGVRFGVGLGSEDRSGALRPTLHSSQARPSL